MRLLVLLYLCFSVFLFSCKKNYSAAYSCGKEITDCHCDPFFFTNFYFTIVDKTTGEDLIFGNNPTLASSDATLFFNYNPPTTHIPQYVDSTNKAIIIEFTKDTMWLQIKNEPLKMITVKKYCLKFCCNLFAVEIVYDGIVYVADDKNIIRLKR